jgi:hypothetical protein
MILDAEVEEEIGVLEVVNLSQFEDLIFFERLEALIRWNTLVEGQIVAVDERERHHLAARHGVEVGWLGFRRHGGFA